MSQAVQPPAANLFDTDHLQADLKRRSVRGGALTLTSQAVKFILQTGAGMILARWLTPEHFGLLAMVTAITGFAEMFKDAGLSMATVQRAKVDHRQVSTLFWINVALSGAIMLVVAASAPAISWYYNEPRLTAITLALAGTFLLGGLTVQHSALLRRQMRFRALVKIDLTTFVLKYSVAVGMALAGFGYWSLVGLALTESGIGCLLYWYASPWRPGPPVRGAGVRSMLAFGGGLTGASLFNYIRDNIPLIMIGKLLGGDQLALFDKAYKLMIMPMSQMNPPLAAVAIPAMSRLQEDPQRFRRTCRRLILLASGLTVPMSIIGVLAAPELIQFFLGDQWGRSAPIFAYLSPLAATQSVSVIAIWILTTTGQARVSFIFSIFNALFTCLSVWIGLFYNLEVAALLFSVVGVLVRTPLLYHYVVANTVVRWGDLLGQSSVFILAGVVLTGAGLWLRYGLLHLAGVSFGWAILSGLAISAIWLALMNAMGMLAELNELRKSWSGTQAA